MPPKKRKAGAAALASKHSNKVRIGSSSVIGDTDDNQLTASGRPKRDSVGEHNYDLTRRHITAGKAAVEAPATNKAAGPPPKDEAEGLKATTRNPTGRPAKLQVEVPKKGGRPRKEDSQPSTHTKTKQGRPLKETKSNLPKAAATKRGKGRPANNAHPANNALDDSTGAVVREDEWEDSADEKVDPEIDNDRQFWLMKAEPESRIEKGHDVKFSIDDLASRTEPEGWDGVRNAVARNNMRAMRKGDLAFFYHSNCSVPGIAGVMQIVREHSIDESAFDTKHPYFDPKSTNRENPKWELVHVKFLHKFAEIITLRHLKTFFLSDGALENMQTLKQSRLSVSAVSPAEWNFIMDLSGESFDLHDDDAEDKMSKDGPDEEPTPQL